MCCEFPFILARFSPEWPLTAPNSSQRLIFNFLDNFSPQFLLYSVINFESQLEQKKKKMVEKGTSLSCSSLLLHIQLCNIIYSYTELLLTD